MKYLTTENAKTVKGEGAGFLTGILYLAPSDQSGVGNVCPHASEGCRAACLYTAGRGRMPNVVKARVRKTRELFARGTSAFIEGLAVDIAALDKAATRKGLKACVRLNGTSDIPWERLKGADGRTLMERFPAIQFYDYTKRPDRPTVWPNYHLTFSRSESNESQALREITRGRNVAVVFNVAKGEPLPATWHDFPVLDGDRSDLRFLDPPAHVVGLRGKGDAKKDATGFLVPVDASERRVA